MVLKKLHETYIIALFLSPLSGWTKKKVKILKFDCSVGR